MNVIDDEALTAAGFDPLPAVGQQWEHPECEAWLPPGHRSIVTITRIGNTASGWQARVVRRQVDPDGAAVESGDGEGVIFLSTLVRDYRLLGG